MLITTKQRQHYLQNNKLAITLNDQELQQVKQHKVIGVVVDENLQWREHVNSVFKKVSHTLALFRRIKHFLPKWSKIMFYNAYISPAAKGYDCAFCDKSTKIGTLLVLYIYIYIN